MSLSTGAAFGPYEIVGLLGRGGMGEVYRARDSRLRRDVAIKVLPAAVATDPNRLRRFQREAQLLASLNHPNIATLHGIEERDGITALVLELVEGETLDVRVKTRLLTPAETLEIARQICEGLDAAHDRGIVHRDLKPGNIKLTPDGVVKLLDFGLAKATRDEAPDLTHSPTEFADTMTGALLGTAPYMSPEQARGRPVDKRTDVWSFGCVLYEMVTGRQAFSGETVSDTIAAILAREPDWTRLPASAPAHIRRVMQRCLEKDPKQRMRDIADVRADLHDQGPALSGAAALVSPTHHRWSWIGGAVAGALIAVAVLLVVGRRTPQDPFPENPLTGAGFTRITDFEGFEHDAAISPDGKFVAFGADRAGRFDIWLSRIGTGQFQNMTQGKEEELLAATRSVGFTPDGSEIWLSGNVPSGRRLRLMPLMGGTPRAFLRDHAVNVAWSPDGARVVFHTGDAGDPMFTADSTGANSRQIFVQPRAGGHNHFPAWSKDGRWIYFVSGVWDVKEMDVWRIRSDGGTPERLTRHNGDVRYVVPIDDRRVLYVAPDEDGSGPWLWTLDVARKATFRVNLGLENYTSVAASADGHRLVTTIANPTASLWTAPILPHFADERDVRPIALPSMRSLAPRFGAESLFYLSSVGAGDGLWRYEDGQAAEIWKSAGGPLLAPAAISSDGRRVAIVLRKQGALRVHVLSSDGAELQPFAETIDVRGAPAWSPDGKWIITSGIDATGEGLFKVPVEGGPAVRLVTGTARNPVWSSKDLIVYAGATVANRAVLQAVRPDGAKLELPPTSVIENGERYRFLPDGSALVYMQGSNPWQDFWLLDLTTMKSRQLTQLTARAAMRTFDITPDGKRIVFDRLRENSDIVLIDLPQRSR